MSEKNTAMEQRASGGEIERTRTGPCLTPDVDIYESDDSLVMLVDMPGVGRDSVSVDLEKGVLSVEGRFQNRDYDEGYKPIFREFEPCSYQRRFTLSDEIDVEGIEAVVTAGVLRLTLPKSKAALPRKIEIK